MASAGLICAFGPCHKPVTDVRRVQVHRAGEGEAVFGAGGESLPLDQADGPLLRTYHPRCWWAQVKRDRLAAARAADPSGHRGRVTDWRDPVTCDVEDLHGGVARDYRGAGKAPD
jgi:hypothetical protein